MIRYAIDVADLRQKILDHTNRRRKVWFDEADELLAALPVKPQEKEFKKIWGVIKDVYIKLQHTKCAFCEQRLEGTITQDVEHFRPKSAVTAFSIPAKLAGEGITVKQPADGKPEKGYRFLAYHILNYAMACKNCNSVFKRNLFPIAKPRKTEAKQPPPTSTEQNYLIYPISDVDDDPESLLDFEGFQPIAKGAGFKRQRALVCIQLFKLDDRDERKELIQGRAEVIEDLYLNLREIADGPEGPVKEAARRNRTRMLQDSQPHANCLRSFDRLFQADRAAADKVFTDISELLATMSPS